jgi:predicted amidohydrolase
VTRYDERRLSNTKVSFMYAPGKIPVTFDLDGLRFGCTLGMEAHYPELFMEYEQLHVDCVLFSTTGETPATAPAFAAEVLGHAAANRYWVSLSAHAAQCPTAPSGVAAPDGRWAIRCPGDGKPSIAVVDIQVEPTDPARPWRRMARSDLYAPHYVNSDLRSDGRDAF